MKSPPPEVIEVLQRLRGRPEGVVIHEYLQAAMADINIRFLHTADPVQLRVLQGEGRVVDTLLGAFKS